MTVANEAFDYVRLKPGEKAAIQARYQEALAPKTEDGLDELIIYGVLALLALGAGGLTYVFLRGRSKEASRKGRKANDSRTERNRTAQPAAMPEPIEDVIPLAQHEAEVADLRRQISSLESTITMLRSELEALKGQPSPADRRSDRPASSGYVETSGGFAENRAAPAPSPTSAPPTQQRSAGSFAESPEVLRLIEEVNTAGKVALNRGGPTDTRVETFANDRTNALEVLFASDTDRFWLVPNPDQPGEAALIPGLNTKSKWGNFKTAGPDHPLAHHFELLQGDRFAIHHAATVRKDASGQWVLVQKGQVSGVS